jgi:type I restriction-modification system DNA methylase subunit
MIHLEYQTPIPVCEYMVDLLPKNVRSVLEPTSGIGNLKGVLKKKKYRVEAPTDFFLFNALSDRTFDAVVMNPPFSEKSIIANNAPKDIDLKGMKGGYYILNECMKRSNIIIALMPWFTILDSDVRLRTMMSFGLISVTTLPRKTFNYIRIQTCILELNKGYSGKTEFKSFDINLLKNKE